MHGLAQEGLFVDDGHFHAVDMKTQHGLLDEILGVLTRAASAAQKFEESLKMCGTGNHGIPAGKSGRAVRIPDLTSGGPPWPSRVLLRAESGCRPVRSRRS